jgi:hypothetical protein
VAVDHRGALASILVFPDLVDIARRFRTWISA